MTARAAEALAGRILADREAGARCTQALRIGRIDEVDNRLLTAFQGGERVAVN